MRKQYTMTEGPAFRYTIVLYHNGKEVEKTEMWFSDELEDYIDSLEDNGYTLGYTNDEIAKAYNNYKYLHENRIARD